MLDGGLFHCGTPGISLSLHRRVDVEPQCSGSIPRGMLDGGLFVVSIARSVISFSLRRPGAVEPRCLAAFRAECSMVRSSYLLQAGVSLWLQRPRADQPRCSRSIPRGMLDSGSFHSGPPGIG
jgi:hypothetical protein